MTKEEAIEQLKANWNDDDIEVAHSNADDILCEFLKALGYSDVVDAWEKVPKWYA